MHERRDEDGIKRLKYAKATVRTNTKYWSRHLNIKWKWREFWRLQIESSAQQAQYDALISLYIKNPDHLASENGRKI
jgi:hypothetical protein